jgi:hypothetical protein
MIPRAENATLTSAACRQLVIAGQFDIDYQHPEPPACGYNSVASANAHQAN